MHQCCDNPDIYEINFGNGNPKIYKCWNCKFEFKPGEPLPEFYQIDEELVDMFKK